MKRKILSTLLIFTMFTVVGCSSQQNTVQEDTMTKESSAGDLNSIESDAPNVVSEAVLEKITAEKAKEMMDASEEYILLDVRTQEEFAEGHIAGAILIPDYEIETKAEEQLSDKSATIFVYCRSGRRSALAAEALSKLGYTSIYDFGGIIDWPYEVVTE